MMHGLLPTAIVKAATELGVFDQIDAGVDDPDSIATAIDADERGVRILLDALGALGLVERDGPDEGRRYRLTPLATSCLVSDRSSYLGDIVAVVAGDWAWAGYPRLAEAVRAGGTVLDQAAETPAHPYWEEFARSSRAFEPAVAYLAETLEPWASARSRLDILDVACGDASRSLALARRHQRARFTLLDWPNVLAVARGGVERLGLEERARFIPGDLFDVPLGGPYDLIVVSQLLHHFSERRCVELLARLAATLRPDGLLAIDEFTAVGPASAEDPWPSLFSVMMLVWTREGEAHSRGAYERMLAAAGFAPPEVHERSGIPNRLLIARVRRSGVDS